MDWRARFHLGCRRVGRWSWQYLEISVYGRRKRRRGFRPCLLAVHCPDWLAHHDGRDHDRPAHPEKPHCSVWSLSERAERIACLEPDRLAGRHDWFSYLIVLQRGRWLGTGLCMEGRLRSVRRAERESLARRVCGAVV